MQNSQAVCCTTAFLLMVLLLTLSVGSAAATSPTGSPSLVSSNSFSVSPSGPSAEASASRSRSTTTTHTDVATMTLSLTLSSDTTLSGSPTIQTVTMAMSFSQPPPSPSITSTNTFSEHPSISRSGPSQTSSLSPPRSYSATWTLTDRFLAESETHSNSVSIERTRTFTEGTFSVQSSATSTYDPRVSTTLAATITRGLTNGHTWSLSPEVPSTSPSISEPPSLSGTVTPPPTPTHTTSPSFEGGSVSRSASDARTKSLLTPTATLSSTLAVGTASILMSPTRGTATPTLTETITNTTSPPRTPTPTSTTTTEFTFTLTQSISQEVRSKTFTASSDLTNSATDTYTNGVSASRTATFGTRSLTRTVVAVTSTGSMSLSSSRQIFDKGAEYVSSSEHSLRLSGVGWNASLLQLNRSQISAVVKADLMRVLNLNSTQVEVLGFSIGSLVVYYRIYPIAAAYISPDLVNALVRSANFSSTATYYRSNLGALDTIEVLNTSTASSFVVPTQSCGNTCVIVVVALITPVLCAALGWFVYRCLRRYYHQRQKKKLHKRKVRRYRIRHGGAAPPKWYAAEPYADGHGPVGWAGDISSETPTPVSPFRPEDDGEGFGDAGSRDSSDYDDDDNERREADDLSSYDFEGRVGYDAAITPHDTHRLDDEDSDIGIEVKDTKFDDDDDVASQQFHPLEDDGEGFGSLPNTSLVPSNSAASPRPLWLATPLRVPWYRPSVERAASDDAAAPPAAVAVGNLDIVAANASSPLTDDALDKLDRQHTPPRTPGVTPRQHRKALQRQRRLSMLSAEPPSHDMHSSRGGRAAAVPADDAELQRYLHDAEESREDFTAHPRSNSADGGSADDDDLYEYEYVFEGSALGSLPPPEAPPAAAVGGSLVHPRAVLQSVEPLRPLVMPKAPPPAPNSKAKVKLSNSTGGGTGALLPNAPRSAPRVVVPPSTEVATPPSPPPPPRVGSVLPSATRAPLDAPASRLTPEVLPHTSVEFNFLAWEESIEFPRAPPSEGAAGEVAAQDVVVEHHAVAPTLREEEPTEQTMQRPAAASTSASPRRHEKRLRRLEEARAMAQSLPEFDEGETVQRRRMEDDEVSQSGFVVAASVDEEGDSTARASSMEPHTNLDTTSPQTREEGGIGERRASIESASGHVFITLPADSVERSTDGDTDAHLHGRQEEELDGGMVGFVPLEDSVERHTGTAVVHVVDSVPLASPQEPPKVERMSLSRRISSLFSFGKSNKDEERLSEPAEEPQQHARTTVVVGNQGTRTVPLPAPLVHVQPSPTTPPENFLTVRVSLPSAASQKHLHHGATSSPASARSKPSSTPPSVKSLPPPAGTSPRPSAGRLALDRRPSAMLLPPSMGMQSHEEDNQSFGSSVASTAASSIGGNPRELLPGMFSPPLVSSGAADLRRTSSMRSTSSAGSTESKQQRSKKRPSKRRSRRERPPVHEDDLIAIVTVDQEEGGGYDFSTPTHAAPPMRLPTKPSVRFRTPSDEE